MRLNKLRLVNFRNIQSLELYPKNILSFIYGDNAQGKTSVIEAIYYLSSLRSFRTHKSSEQIRMGCEKAQIEAEITAKNLRSELKIILEPKSRKLALNQKTTTASKFVTRLKTVVFSPESLASIKSGPDSRRELVDQAVLQLSAAAPDTQNDYSRSLRQRNACLRQIRDGSLSILKGREILDSLEVGFIKLATEMTLERLQFLDQVLPKQREILNQIVGETVELEIGYQSSETNWTQRTKSEISDRIWAELSDPKRRLAEEAVGVTLTGPHRHDIRFLFNGNDSRIFCSQGQQRALILAFKIAEIVYHSEVYGSYPLLLLDDVLSEFDEKKRNFLIDFLRRNEAQTFLTTTDQTQKVQGCSIYQIKAGQIFEEA